MKERCGARKVHVAINHSNVPDEAADLKNKVSLQLQCVELYVTDVYPVVGRHGGPLNLYLNWWAED